MLLALVTTVPALAFITGEKFWWPGRAISIGAEVRTTGSAARP